MFGCALGGAQLLVLPPAVSVLEQVRLSFDVCELLFGEVVDGDDESGFRYGVMVELPPAPLDAPGSDGAAPEVPGIVWVPVPF